MFSESAEPLSSFDGLTLRKEEARPGITAARTAATWLARSLPLWLWKRIAPQEVIGLCYHLACDTPLPHIHNLYKYKSAKQLEDDLVYLKQNFHVASYSELETGVRGESVVVTFDDGLAQCFTIVRQILLK